MMDTTDKGHMLTGPPNYCYSQRAGSMTSFTSLSSMAQGTQMAARDISTSSLFELDYSKFSKTARTKSMTPSLSSAVSINSVRRQTQLPRSQSFQQSPLGTQQPPLGLHSGTLRKSESLTSIPTARRQTVERQTLNQFRQLHLSQQVRPGATPPPQSSSSSTQQPLLRRHGNRPRQPFTFPNGEVYIPRSKQRGSLSNLSKLSTPSEIDTPAPPSCGAIGQSPRSAPHSNSGSSSTITSESLSKPNPDHDFLTISFQNQQLSCSPSPSGASRTNSSVNESTPPSSIDDFTILHNMKTDNIAIPSASFLQKIDESTVTTPHVADSTMSSPAPTLVTKEQGFHSKSTVDMSPEGPIIPERQDLPLSSVVVKPASRGTSQRLAQGPVTRSQVSRRVPSPPQMQLPSQRPIETKAKPNQVEVQRKPSGLRKFFSKLFSSKKSRQAATAKRQVTTTKKQPVNTITVTPEPVAARTPTNTPKAIGEVPFDIVKKTADEGDTFSFVEGDEDAGINVGDLTLKLNENECDEYKSELILDTLFSKLSGSEKRPVVVPVETLDVDEKKIEALSTDEDTTADNDDHEDFVMTFDDMEFIERITEFGETSFPDLGSPDLGQSQRKMMRSKSIERRKSIRSVSSSSKWSQPTTNAATSVNITDKDDHECEQKFQIITTNQIRVPSAHGKSPSSILKKERTTIPSKKVGFLNKLYVNTTHCSNHYNRHSAAVSSYNLSPKLVQQIRRDLNEFKRQMVVHQESVTNTHFFRP